MSVFPRRIPAAAVPPSSLLSEPHSTLSDPLRPLLRPRARHAHLRVARQRQNSDLRRHEPPGQLLPVRSDRHVRLDPPVGWRHQDPAVERGGRARHRGAPVLRRGGDAHRLPARSRTRPPGHPDPRPGRAGTARLCVGEGAGTFVLTRAHAIRRTRQRAEVWEGTYTWTRRGVRQGT